MAQHDYVIDNSTGANVRADLNNALQAIVTNNSGSSAPSATFPFMLFADSAAGTMKIRNAADNAFIELFQLDGTFTLEDGSASTPALAFRDDLNTGIFSGGADEFNIATGGTERFVINSSGNCGIGTTSPSNKLEINNTTSDQGILIKSTGNNYHTICGDANRSSSGDNIFRIDSKWNGTVVNRIRMIAGSDTTNKDDGIICFDTASGGAMGERMRIDSSGNVMIGLTSTGNKFHVEGTTTGSRFGVDDSASGITALAITNEVNADFEHVIFTNKASFGSSVNIPICFHTNGKANEKMRIDTSGNVGIATTSGGGKLAILSNSSTYEGLELQTPSGDASGEFHIGVHQSGSTAGRTIVFKRGGSDGMTTESMRIDTDGRLLLGTTSPTEGASTGHLVSTFAGNSDIGFKCRDTNGGSVNHIVFVSTSNIAGVISGNSSSVSYGTSSDYRLKENVVAISDGITRLKTLKPSRFNFKVDKDKTVDGFLAHEVTAVPEAITGTKDQVATDDDVGYTKGDPIYQSIDQSKLVPLLVAAVQELIGKVEALEAA